MTIEIEDAHHKIQMKFPDFRHIDTKLKVHQYRVDQLKKSIENLNNIPESKLLKRMKI